MNPRVLTVCAFGGPAAVIVTLVGWSIAGVLPLPIGPGAPQAEVMSFYLDNSVRTGTGFVIASLGIVLYAPLVALTTMHMLRIEGRRPVLAFTQLATGTATLLINGLPMLLWALATFRADRSADTVLLLHDMGWLILFPGIMLFCLQNISIGLAVVTSDGSVFPRWLGYLNFFVALSFVPDPLAFFFHSGPLAWNGVFVFWLALTTYCIFLCATTWACLRANATLGSALDRPRRRDETVLSSS
ncbi:hypothetical protein [Rhodococcoides fascians]|uniref:hypothetical protein n=1 Tax=Rhodococcoides fascians TaxID=1828 RepID=UPI000AF7F38F|nr:hypothetical protein [Rhodococcus fascians]